MARKNATAEAIELLRTDIRTNGVAIELLGAEVHTNGAAIELLRTDMRTNGVAIELLGAEVHTNGVAIELLGAEVHTNGESIARSNVLMGDMRSQFKAVVEMVVSTRADLIAHFDARFTKIEERLDVLEFAVRKSSEDIQAMRVEIRQLRADFDRREERARIDALEKRVDKLESIAGEDA